GHAGGDAGRAGAAGCHRRRAGDARAHRPAPTRSAGEELVSHARGRAHLGGGGVGATGGGRGPRELIARRRREAPEKNWYLTREYVLTWAASPPANAITRGRWWTADEAAARPRVSVDDEAARYFGVGV